jgi:tetratricopeptide (TPR) repeat protein
VLPATGTPLLPRPLPATPVSPTPRLFKEGAAPVAIAPAKPQESTAGLPAASAASTRSKASALFNRALAAQEAGDLQQAATLLEQALKLDPTSKVAYNSLGNVYYQQQQYHQASTMYKQALAIDPHYAKARNNLGNTYMQLAMDERAIEELQQALRADSSYSLTYYNLACVYARAGNSQAAVQYLQQAMALEPQARLWAQTDADFAPVRDAPEVRQLLGL